MKALQRAMAMIGLTMGMPKSVFYATKKALTRRPCVNCGNPHSHNNAFCSATCCKTFKREMMAKGGFNVPRRVKGLTL